MYFSYKVTFYVVVVKKRKEANAGRKSIERKDGWMFALLCYFVLFLLWGGGGGGRG